MVRETDSMRGWVRALWPGEEERLVGHLLRLGPDDRYSRFLGIADDATVRQHVERARRQRWQVIGWFEAGVLRAAVEIVTTDGTAEAALTTEPGYRGHGIAGRLLARAARRAALSGAARLVIYTSRSNAAVMRIARGMGMLCHEEAGEVRAELALSRPGSLVLYREFVEERHGQLASASAQLFPLAGQFWSAMLTPAR